MLQLHKVLIPFPFLFPQSIYLILYQLTFVFFFDKIASLVIIVIVLLLSF